MVGEATHAVSAGGCGLPADMGCSPGSAQSACPSSIAPRSTGSCGPGSRPWPAAPASSGGGGRTCGPASDAAAWCRASRCSLRNRVNTEMPAVSTLSPGWLLAQDGCTPRLSSTSPYPWLPASAPGLPRPGKDSPQTVPSCRVHLIKEMVGYLWILQGSIKEVGVEMGLGGGVWDVSLCELVAPTVE